MQSVNSSMIKQAPEEVMIQLGQCVQRLIATLAENYDENTPLRFSKIYIKDGCWSLAVSDTDVWKFCYMLPQ